MEDKKPTMQEILAAKKATEAAEAFEVPAEQTAGAAEAAALGDVSTEEPAADEAPQDPPVVATGGYKNIRGRAIIRADGTKMAPDEDGLLHPSTEEELQLCQYFEGLGHLAAV